MAADSPKPRTLDYATPPARRPFRNLRRVENLLLLVGIIALTVSIVLPVSQSYREARAPRCSSHMRQLGTAMLIYAQSHEGRFPDRLEDLLLTEQYIEPKTFLCPSTTDTPAPGQTRAQQAANLHAGGHCSYLYLGKGLTDKATYEVPVLYEPLSNHAGDGSNVLYADGHVEFVLPQQLARLLATTRPTTAPATRGAK